MKTNGDDLVPGFMTRKGVRTPVMLRPMTGHPTRRRSKDAFVMIPLHWVGELSKLKGNPTVWLSVIFAAWEAKGQSFKFSDTKLLGKCSRWTKARGLAELQAAGWIEVAQEVGRAPVVTLIGPGSEL
jgi:hypothetical protein